MKKLMITGSYPPNDVCGVGDYTACFMAETNKQEWALYYSNDWSLKTLKNKIKEINSYNSKFIIMQYPTQGYGWSIVPQFIALYYSLFTKKKFITVLHEFSQRTTKAKIATIPFLLSDNIIFTNTFEKNFAEKILPFRKNKYNIIKIFSNISSPKKINSLSERDYDICYFGHIRPLKGLEDFIEVVSKFKNKKILIIGQVLNEYKEYANKMEKECINGNISFMYNKRIEEVSNLLNKTKIAFLPFPDGVSERRGTMLAALSNGTVVVTYKGKFSTDGLIKTCFITNKENAFKDISNLLEGLNDSKFANIQEMNKEYLNKEIPHSWKDIVNMYDTTINSIL